MVMNVCDTCRHLSRWLKSLWLIIFTFAASSLFSQKFEEESWRFYSGVKGNCAQIWRLYKTSQLKKAVDELAFVFSGHSNLKRQKPLEEKVLLSKQLKVSLSRMRVRMHVYVQDHFHFFNPNSVKVLIAKAASMRYKVNITTFNPKVMTVLPIMSTFIYIFWFFTKDFFSQCQNLDFFPLIRLTFYRKTLITYLKIFDLINIFWIQYTEISFY